jgi:hypothetical protein
MQMKRTQPHRRITGVHYDAAKQSLQHLHTRTDCHQTVYLVEEHTMTAFAVGAPTYKDRLPSDSVSCRRAHDDCICSGRGGPVGADIVVPEAGGTYM